ncbi:hypothetical protein V5O48_017191 [Marasmius crinis-equi]|uniref:ABM domain-containing protein n=1 Tax=Marasmius crinis-equi TaxID=585013 RepID=A0ABR3EPV7_9AGAR
MLFLVSLFIAAFALPRATVSVDTQPITIQSFPLRDSSQSSVQELANAMSKFKASTGGKIENAFLGLISSDVAVAEQIFLWSASADSEQFDITHPFLPFSTSDTQVNISTATVSNKTSLHDALHSPITETIVQELVPGVDLNDLGQILNYLSGNIRITPGGYASTAGFDEEDGKTRVVVVNGWESVEAANNWVANQDNATSTQFHRFWATLVGGEPTPTWKHVVEVD